MLQKIANMLRGKTHYGTSQPGWYADPDGPPLQRYWNGREWTEEYREYPDSMRYRNPFN